jgi:hypothetical protein
MQRRCEGVKLRRPKRREDSQRKKTARVFSSERLNEYTTSGTLQTLSLFVPPDANDGPGFAVNRQCFGAARAVGLKDNSRGAPRFDFIVDQFGSQCTKSLKFAPGNPYLRRNRPASVDIDRCCRDLPIIRGTCKIHLQAFRYRFLTVAARKATESKTLTEPRPLGRGNGTKAAG